MGIAWGTDHAWANEIPFFFRRTSVKPHRAVKQQQRHMKKRVDAMNSHWESSLSQLASPSIAQHEVQVVLLVRTQHARGQEWGNKRGPLIQMLENAAPMAVLLRNYRVDNAIQAGVGSFGSYHDRKQHRKTLLQTSTPEKVGAGSE